MPKRKTYRKPKIVYQKEIETLAVTCSSAWQNDEYTCRLTAEAGCERTSTA